MREILYTKYEEFGIPHGGDVETPVLRFLHKYRDYDFWFHAIEIAEEVKKAEGLDFYPKSVGDALNRLHYRPERYVVKRKSRRNRRRKEWQLRRNADVYREVEKRIRIYRPSPAEHYEGYHEEAFTEDYIDEISNTAVKLSPLKIALQSIFPPATLPLEIGYQILSNLDTVRNMYNLTTVTLSDEFKNTLNETVKNAAKLAYPHIVGFIAQPIKDAIIPNIIETSSKYLEQKDIFKDVTESLNLDVSYSDDFKDFYKASLSNCLKDKFNRYTGHVG